jgi:SAM-dependent methyltransferase
MVAITRNKYKNVDVSIGDVCNTPYENESMGLILCVGVSEYIEDLDALLAEIKRILSHTGFAILTSSPPGMINQLRKVQGHKLFLRSQEEMKAKILFGGYKILKLNHTMIQNQYLLHKRL